MWRDERGSVLVLVLLCATLFLALGGALVVVASTESTISATFRESAAALAGAEAAIVRVTADLATAPDVTAILSGGATSTFIDGPAAGPRRVPDGTVVDLADLTSIERCGNVVCTSAQLDAITADRPWGANNPRWQRYASGWLRDLTPQVDVPHVYVIVWVGDDPLETDADPLADDADPDALGHDAVLIRAVAHAAYSVRRRLEVVARRESGVIRLTSWREIR
jgi:hypothetical protein